MKLLVINGNGYSIFPPSGAWFFLSERGFLTALSQSGALHKITTEKPDLEYLYFDEQELDENTAAEPTVTTSLYSRTSGMNWRRWHNGNHPSYSR